MDFAAVHSSITLSRAVKDEYRSLLDRSKRVARIDPGQPRINDFEQTDLM